MGNQSRTRRFAAKTHFAQEGRLIGLKNKNKDEDKVEPSRPPKCPVEFLLGKPSAKLWIGNGLQAWADVAPWPCRVFISSVLRPVLLRLSIEFGPNQMFRFPVELGSVACSQVTWGRRRRKGREARSRRDEDAGYSSYFSKGSRGSLGLVGFSHPYPDS